MSTEHRMMVPQWHSSVPVHTHTHIHIVKTLTCAPTLLIFSIMIMIILYATTACIPYTDLRLIHYYSIYNNILLR